MGETKYIPCCEDEGYSFEGVDFNALRKWEDEQLAKYKRGETNLIPVTGWSSYVWD